jgi:hypothetical protein
MILYGNDKEKYTNTGLINQQLSISFDNLAVPRLFDSSDGPNDNNEAR